MRLAATTRDPPTNRSRGGSDGHPRTQDCRRSQAASSLATPASRSASLYPCSAPGSPPRSAARRAGCGIAIEDS
eukprot:scaffold1019_cov255-Pinguiococcus_pyrenoidosus.AAC.17